ncbi:MAG: MFS transporter [Chromatiaceae bacterium]|jgi:PPP family 3-phenylpropionic acid transporter|nr:MFS transporter [Chromatiaceae bacterium]
MPYWRLSAFYFFYFAALGALVPYWGLYLQDQGLTPLAIGQLMAILMATKIVAPNVWGWIADQRGARLPIVRLASLLALIAFTGIFAVHGFWGIALVMTFFSFFWNASLPQMEAVTFNHLGARMRRYSTIRLWGSIGFILAVLALGAVLERTGTGLVPEVVLVLFVGVWVSSLLVPERAGARARQDDASVRVLLRRPEVVAFLASGALMQMSHGAYYAFYSIHLTGAGYSTGAVGALWAWGVTVEVLVFLRMHWLLERFGARRVLLASLALAILRWLLIGGFVEHLGVQVLAQALHAATFGAFHASAVHLAHHYFVGRTQGRGQALYNSLSFGVGGALGALSSGGLWTAAGASATFALAALAAGLGWLTAWRWVDRAHRF